MIDLTPENRTKLVFSALAGALVAVIIHLVCTMRRVRYLEQRDTQQLCRDARAAQVECEEAALELAATERDRLKNELRSELLRELNITAGPAGAKVSITPGAGGRNAEDA